MIVLYIVSRCPLNICKVFKLKLTQGTSIQHLTTNRSRTQTFLILQYKQYNYKTVILNGGHTVTNKFLF